MHASGTRVPHSDQTGKNAAHPRVYLIKNASGPPTSMHKAPGVHKRSHGMCIAVHDNKQPDSPAWPGHCSARKHAALPTDDRFCHHTKQWPRSPATSGRSRTGVRRTQPADEEWRKAHSTWLARQSGRGSRARFEWAGTFGHRIDQAPPARSP